MIPASRYERIELLRLLEERQRRRLSLGVKSAYAMMYDWQREFVKATSRYYESCLCAANQIGKTFTGTTIDAAHLTGDYPDDWEGHRFDHAPLVWCLGYSMEKTRDLLQTALFGSLNNRKFSGGIITADRIDSYESVTGTANAARTVNVKHSSGAISSVQFWSYSQGQHAIMGDIVDWFHIDEEPRDQSIRPQVLTRTINGDNGRGGRGIYTFTPENGKTELVLQFSENASPDQFYMQKGWVDAPHMTPEKQERMLAQYPAHQREMRSKGVPMLGHGLIYELSEDFITCDPFEIPDHWFVINGLDFGWDHPQAHVQIVEDRDTETIYVTKAWKERHVGAETAWGAVKSWSDGVPVAWPQDGLQHEKGRDDSKKQRDHYIDAGFNMLHDHATWQTGGNSVESGIYEIRDLMQKGKLKIFRGVRPVLDEMLQYHRDEKGKRVDRNDDALDALRYAMMMRRYAICIGDINKEFKDISFAGWGQ